MLPEERRKQLDGIVGQMTANRENDDAISFVVNDFKNKYGVEEPEERFSEKAAKVLDTIFGGGKVGELIGTQIAKAGATPEEKRYITGPTKGEVFGSALQSAALFAPVGTVAKGITGGARAVGMVKGASALGKIGSGALAGELFDVATNLQNGKTGKEALTPGLGALLGGGLPAAGVAKNVIVRMGERQAPRVINSLIKPLAKDFSYGKNPGRAIAEEGIIANDFDELLTGIRASREKVGKEIGEMSAQFSTQPIIDISKTLSPLDDAIKTAVSQNNQGLVTRLNNSRRAIVEVLEPTMDDMGNIGIKSAGGRNLTNLTFKQVRNILGEIGDMTQFTGNPSDDKLVNSALKGVYGKIKGESLKYARELNPEMAKGFEKLTEKYADLSSAEIATRYRDKMVERQALIGLSPQTAGIGAGIITAVATGGATLPSVVVGASAALLDKLASTPGFKTRLAYLLSKKSTNEVNYLFRKVPALKRFFSLKEGVSPGDVILGNRAEGVEKGITGYIKNPKLGLSVEDVSKREFQNFNDLSTKLLSKLEGRTTVSKQFISDLTNSPDLKQAERDLVRRVLSDMSPESVGDYAMSHRPSTGPSAFNLTEKVDGEQMIPKDMYEQWYGSRGTKADKESIAVLKTLKDKPEATVTIYRASPKSDFNNGDWVTLSKTYAEEHARGNGTKVYSKVVKAKDLKWAMDDVNEFGYYPTVSDQIIVKDFANKVKSELLPLTSTPPKDSFGRLAGGGRNADDTAGLGYRYENITLPSELRGPVADYKERIYNSPIKTSAGGHHFDASNENYFAHSRIEDLPADIRYKSPETSGMSGYNKKQMDVYEEALKDANKRGTTRRVIEIQSDLFQKGRLEGELNNTQKIIEDPRAKAYFKKKLGDEPWKKLKDMPYRGGIGDFESYLKDNNPKLFEEIVGDVNKSISKLEPYRNTWHERVIREEVKKAAQDGKTKLQFPTGETAMKIEGLGETSEWYFKKNKLTPETLKVGQSVYEARTPSSDWIITDVLGDGKFKAIPKRYSAEEITKLRKEGLMTDAQRLEDEASSRNLEETFDISGKVDTSNPIYKFYEKEVGRYLKNKYNAELVTDAQGVKWWEVKVDKQKAKLPIEAFGVAPLLLGDKEEK